MPLFEPAVLAATVPNGSCSTNGSKSFSVDKIKIQGLSLSDNQSHSHL